jgi:hypothetical protein
VFSTHVFIRLIASSWVTRDSHPSSVPARQVSTLLSRPMTPTARRVMGGRISRGIKSVSAMEEQAPDPVSLPDQFPGEVISDKSGYTGDPYIHVSSFSIRNQRGSGKTWL